MKELGFIMTGRGAVELHRCLPETPIGEPNYVVAVMVSPMTPHKKYRTVYSGESRDEAGQAFLAWCDWLKDKTMSRKELHEALYYG